MSTATHEIAPAESERKRLTWFVFIFLIVYKLLVLALTLPLCVPIVSEGMRQMASVTATRMHRLPFPFIGNLRRFEGWDRLDLAVFFAVLLPVATWFLMLLSLHLLLAPREFFERWRFDPAIFSKTVMVLSILFVGADFICFYVGLNQQGGLFASAGFSFSALIASVAYMGAVAVTALGAVMISKI